jgi:hypothetical protein
MELGRFLIILAFVLLISGIYFVSERLGYAYADDYFTAMRFEADEVWTFDTKPIVCFAKPQNTTELYQYMSKHSMINGVLEWKKKLNSTYYDIDVFLPQTNEQYQKCNIHITWVENIVVKDLTTGIPAGLADCQDEHCNLYISLYVMRESSIKNTHGVIKHEFGHAIGVSHRYFDNIYDMARVAVSNDVMFFSNGHFRWITDEDLLVVHTIYGDDGWSGQNKDIGKLIIGKTPK